MGIIEIINVPLLIGAIGILIFFIWLGRYAERMDEKRDNIEKSQDNETKM